MPRPGANLECPKLPNKRAEKLRGFCASGSKGYRPRGGPQSTCQGLYFFGGGGGGGGGEGGRWGLRFRSFLLLRGGWGYQGLKGGALFMLQAASATTAEQRLETADTRRPALEAE